MVDLLHDKLSEKQVLINEPMEKHTSFQIGGPADLFVIPNTVEQLQYVLFLCKEKQFPYYILGNGSNLLVLDKGYRGMMIQIYKNFSEVNIQGTAVMAETGILLSTLSKKIAKAGLSGFEFASGIPGTLGGAIYMNAGAYGGEIKQVLSSITVINEAGELETLGKEDLELGYRMSILQKRDVVAVKAVLELEEGISEEIQRAITDLTVRRKEKQPLEMPSAGSTFKRPQGYYAGKLIMDSGLKGVSIGDAQVSDKHCGFVVNKGNATASDVLKLIRHVKDTVYTKYGVALEPEVRIIGEP